jgi:hypothetical protein
VDWLYLAEVFAPLCFISALFDICMTPNGRVVKSLAKSPKKVEPTGIGS